MHANRTRARLARKLDAEPRKSPPVSDWVTTTAIIDAGCACGIHVTSLMVKAAVSNGTLAVTSKEPLRICADSANRWLSAKLHEVRR